MAGCTCVCARACMSESGRDGERGVCQETRTPYEARLVRPACARPREKRLLQVFLSNIRGRRRLERARPAGSRE